MRIVKDVEKCIIKMSPEDELRIIVPASKTRFALTLRVSPKGKLTMLGDSEFIESIAGDGMKFRIRP